MSDMNHIPTDLDDQFFNNKDFNIKNYNDEPIPENEYNQNKLIDYKLVITLIFLDLFIRTWRYVCFQ
jgi:hypothetical protein